MTPGEGRFSRLLTEIEATGPSFAATLRQLESSWATSEAGDEEITELVSDVLLRSVSAGLFTLPGMLEGFQRFAHDFHDRQSEFLRSRSYRARDYAEVCREVYENDEYMRSVYYPALLSSYVASPNYRHLLRQLERTLAGWEADGAARILEVASGHAFLLLFALRRLSRAHGIGTDIAPAAGRFAADLQRITGWGTGRFQMLVTDVLAEPTQLHAELAAPFDAALCCELLEHVPDPGRFLRAIHARLRDGGRLFLSAAVRMESVDHLTLFESTAHVAKLLDETGFVVDREMSVPFVTRRPADATQWRKLLDNPMIAATYVSECHKVS